MVCHGESFVVGGDDRGEQFAREFLPEVIEKVLQRTRNRSMVIRRAKNDHVGFINTGFQREINSAFVGDVWIEESERFLGEIDFINIAALLTPLFSDVL